MFNNIKLLKNYLLYFLLLILVCMVGISGVFADTITNYSTNYYYGTANSTSISSTGYRSGVDNRLTLYPGQAPTYADAETFNGFYNNINYQLVKGTTYTVSMKVSMSNLYDTEIGISNINNRLLNVNFAHCTNCTFNNVSGSIRKYNASSQIANNLYDYVVTVNYTFVATNDANSFYLGSYTNDDRTMGIYQHTYTSVVMITDLTIDTNNSGIITNQNQTIIDQNQTIIDQNNQNTTNIINNIDNITEQLGNCIENIYNNNNVVYLDNFQYSGNNLIQIQADTNNSPNLKLQYFNNSAYVSTNDYSPAISIGKFRWTFTKNNNFNRIRFGVNGSQIDSIVAYNVSNLINGQEYTLIYNVDNITQGQITISNIMLLKGNVNSSEYIPQGQSKCTSKLDATNDAINDMSSNIINNNNTNTDNIINNQNQNTQEQIDSQKVCQSKLIDSSFITENNKLLNSNGTLSSSTSGNGVTDYIEFSNTIQVKATYQSSAYLCFYDSNKTFISCTQNNNLVYNAYLNVPSNARFVRFTINKRDNVPRFQIDYCQNGNQALNDSITGLNDSLNDDDSSGATNEASEFFNSFTTNTFGLTSIISAPLNLIQSLTSSSCTELHLPLPYLNNKYLDLPCMTTIYQTHFGLFFTMYQTITYGIIAYWVCVRIFNQVKDFKNPEHDEIEVVDL